MARALVVALLAAATVVAPLAAQGDRITLGGPAETAPCAPVSGRFVAFLAPDGALAVMAATSFPGARSWTTLAPSGGDVAVPGIGSLSISGSGQLWGLLDRTLAGNGRAACLAFDKDRFTWTSDLLTYVHWMLREVLLRLPGPAAPALTVGSRQVTLEVGGPGVRPIQLTGVEGASLGLQLPGTGVRLLFMPLVLDGEGREVAVKVIDPAGELFDVEPARELGLVRLGTEAPVPLATEPPITLRLVSVSG